MQGAPGGEENQMIAIKKMEWFTNLYANPTVGSAILFLSITIAMGLWLGRLKVGGISLGITWILFVGILFGHLGVRIEENTLHFAKEFGLILFIYAIGLQVGPGFFESLKQGGMKLNLLAVAVVALGVAVTYVIASASGVDLATMTGIYTGAITNTPGLGAAQQTYADIHGAANDTLAMGYATAYPLGVVGIIFSCLLLRWIFKIKLESETVAQDDATAAATQIVVRVTSQELIGRSISEACSRVGVPIVVSQVKHPDGAIEVANKGMLLKEGDLVVAEIASENREKAAALLGEECPDENFSSMESCAVVSRRIAVTNAKINGMRLEQLHIRTLYNVNITRICRSGIELLATKSLQLQMGDRVSVVGAETDVEHVAELLGNKMKRLDQPNIIPIFLGIFLGIILGSIPLKFPGLPMPVKLGLAGGPLITAILIGRFGPYYKMVTYTTTSANLMLREVGISLFLAAVGLGAGEHFVETIAGGGYMWVVYGLAITLVPLIIVGFFARAVLHLDYFSIAGLIAGSTTDPPALAYANSLSDNSQASVAYATVYPITMFLRILTAQLLIILA